MLNHFLDSKITKTAGLDSLFNSESQIGVLKNAASLLTDEISTESSKGWFMSLYGMSNIDSNKLAADAQDRGYAVVRPKEKSYDILYNPASTEEVDGGNSGRLHGYTEVKNQVTYAHMISKDKKTPTVMAHSTKDIERQDSTNHNTAQILNNTGPSNPASTSLTVLGGIQGVAGTPTWITNMTANGSDLPALPVDSTGHVITGLITSNSTQSDSGNIPVNPFSSQMDIQSDGTAKPTSDNGLGPSRQSIRTGTLLKDLNSHHSTTMSNSDISSMFTVLGGLL